MTVDYTVDGGGTNPEPLSGLSARATFTVEGTQFTILLENTSEGVPVSFEAADSLVVSLGMNLPGVDIVSGDLAIIGPGSIGIGEWSALGEGDSVADEWLWTNDFGGDIMDTHAHVISTSDGQGGGMVTRFDGLTGNVDGPYGGVAAAPPIVPVPEPQRAVSDSILFSLTLTGTLTEEQLQSVADTSIVEFGSDQQYLHVPEPGTVALLVMAGVFFLCRKRR